MRKNKPNQHNKTTLEESDTYISLQEATKCCNYSQEYLSFRARQGKLKAVKFNRNWVTKKEWILEYLAKVEDYNNKIRGRELVQESPFLPQDLPVEKDEESVPTKPNLLRNLKLSPIPIAILLGGFLITVSFYGKVSFRNVYNDLDPYVVSTSQAGSLVLSTYSQIIKDSYKEADIYVRETSRAGDIIIGETGKSVKSSFVNVGNQTASIGGSSKDYSNWIIYICIAAFGGGVFRGLLGFLKHKFSCKNVPFRLNYFSVMIFVSGIIGLVVAIATKELGLILLNNFTPALAFIIGYAGGDFIENIYKIIIKKSNLYEK